MEQTVFHQGELAVQRLAGEEKMAKRVQRVIQGGIMFEAMRFMANQLFVVVSSMDENHQLWTSVLFGPKGFITVDSTKTFYLNIDKLHSSETDIFFQNIALNPQVGTLFIDHGLRVRYRVNGTVQLKKGTIEIKVEEAYGNCPKYIQASAFASKNDATAVSAKQTHGERLTEKQLSQIKNAHTFYMATRSKTGRMDASHRGGNTGFIEVLKNNILRIPDYPGNSMFNSLGNIHENPQTGLLFVDYPRGAILQLTGKASLQFDQNDPSSLQKSGNTGRFWLFQTEKWIATQNHHQIDYKFLEYSPYNP